MVVRDVSTRTRVAILLGETEVNDVDDVVCRSRLGCLGDDKVCGLDVAMDEVARVDVLDARDLEDDDVRARFGLGRRRRERRKARSHGGTADGDHRPCGRPQG